MSQQIQLKNKSGNVYPNPFWPVGSIYISVVNENPSKYFGGTWARFGNGKCLVGVSESESEFNTVQKTGGAKTVGLSTANMPSHNHSLSINTTSLTGEWQYYHASTDLVQGGGIVGTASTGVTDSYTGTTSNKRTRAKWTINASHNHSGSVGYSGSGTAHNNLQPYITVYLWRRTA